MGWVVLGVFSGSVYASQAEAGLVKVDTQTGKASPPAQEGDLVEYLKSL